MDFIPRSFLHTFTKRTMAQLPLANAYSDDAACVTKAPGDAADRLQPRAFQYEMLEESLRGNVVVAVCSTPRTPASAKAG